jgi:hypothetical protein
MTDEEFDILLEAAFQEAANDPESDPDMDPTDLALDVHSDLLETNYSDLYVRGKVSDLEIQKIEAMKQAIVCYRLLLASRNFQQWITLLNNTPTTELNEKEMQDRARVLQQAHTNLIPLDEVEPFARETLAGLGLSTTIEEFEDFEGNNYRIKLDIQACTLASESVLGKLTAAVAALAGPPDF